MELYVNMAKGALVSKISYKCSTFPILLMISLAFADGIFSQQKLRIRDVSSFQVNNSAIQYSGIVLSETPNGNECQKMFESLSLAVLNYSQCLITNAIHSTVCSNCVWQHETARVLFETDFEAIHDDFGQLCSDRMILSAGKQMKAEAESFVTNSWNNLHCAGCFGNQSNGQLLPEYGEFFNAFHLLIDCILDSSNAHVDVKLFAPLNVTGNNTVCRDCGELWYRQLHDIYIKLNMRDVARVCQDIGDVMNYTRYVWRDVFECKSKPRNNILLWIVSAFLSVLPITFYFASFLNGSDITKKLVLQKRLRDHASVQHLANASVS